MKDSFWRKTKEKKEREKERKGDYIYIQLKSGSKWKQENICVHLLNFAFYFSYIKNVNNRIMHKMCAICLRTLSMLELKNIATYIASQT